MDKSEVVEFIKKHDREKIIKFFMDNSKTFSDFKEPDKYNVFQVSGGEWIWLPEYEVKGLGKSLTVDTIDGSQFGFDNEIISLEVEVYLWCWIHDDDVVISIDFDNEEFKTIPNPLPQDLEAGELLDPTLKVIKPLQAYTMVDRLGINKEKLNLSKNTLNKIYSSYCGRLSYYDMYDSIWLKSAYFESTRESIKFDEVK